MGAVRERFVCEGRRGSGYLGGDANEPEADRQGWHCDDCGGAGLKARSESVEDIMSENILGLSECPGTLSVSL